MVKPKKDVDDGHGPPGVERRVTRAVAKAISVSPPNVSKAGNMTGVSSPSLRNRRAVVPDTDLNKIDAELGTPVKKRTISRAVSVDTASPLRRSRRLSIGAEDSPCVPLPKTRTRQNMLLNPSVIGPLPEDEETAKQDHKPNDEVLYDVSDKKATLKSPKSKIVIKPSGILLKRVTTSPKKNSSSKNDSTNRKNADENRGNKISAQVNNVSIESQGDDEIEIQTDGNVVESKKVETPKSHEKAVEKFDTNQKENSSVAAINSQSPTQKELTETSEEGQISFPKSWSQSIRITLTDKSSHSIDKITNQQTPEKSATPKKCTTIRESIESKKETSMDISDDDDDLDSDDDHTRTQFFDNEAIEVSGDGDSLDSSERQYLELNEIPIQGESIGSEDTTDNEPEEATNGSDLQHFIVTDSESDKLSGKDSLMDSDEEDETKVKTTRRCRRVFTIDSSECEENENKLQIDESVIFVSQTNLGSTVKSEIKKEMAEQKLPKLKLPRNDETKGAVVNGSITDNLQAAEGNSTANPNAIEGKSTCEILNFAPVTSQFVDENQNKTPNSKESAAFSENLAFDSSVSGIDRLTDSPQDGEMETALENANTVELQENRVEPDYSASDRTSTNDMSINGEDSKIEHNHRETQEKLPDGSFKVSCQDGESDEEVIEATQNEVKPSEPLIISNATKCKTFQSGDKSPDISNGEVSVESPEEVASNLQSHTAQKSVDGGDISTHVISADLFDKETSEEQSLTKRQQSTAVLKRQDDSEESDEEEVKENVNRHSSNLLNNSNTNNISMKDATSNRIVTSDSDDSVDIETLSFKLHNHSKSTSDNRSSLLIKEKITEITVTTSNEPQGTSFEKIINDSRTEKIFLISSNLPLQKCSIEKQAISSDEEEGPIETETEVTHGTSSKHLDYSKTSDISLKRSSLQSMERTTGKPAVLTDDLSEDSPEDDELVKTISFHLLEHSISSSEGDSEDSAEEGKEVAPATSFKKLKDSKRGSTSFKQANLPTKKHSMEKVVNSSNEDSPEDNVAKDQKSKGDHPSDDDSENSSLGGNEVASASSFKLLENSKEGSPSFKRDSLSGTERYIDKAGPVSFSDDDSEDSAEEGKEVATAISFKKLYDSKRGSVSFKQVNLSTKKRSMEKVTSFSNKDFAEDNVVNDQKSKGEQASDDDSEDSPSGGNEVSPASSFKLLEHSKGGSPSFKRDSLSGTKRYINKPGPVSSSDDDSAEEGKEVATATSFQKLNDSKRGSASFKQVNLSTKQRSMEKVASSSNEDSEEVNTANGQKSKGEQASDDDSEDSASEGDEVAPASSFKCVNDSKSGRSEAKKRSMEIAASSSNEDSAENNTANDQQRKADPPFDDDSEDSVEEENGIATTSSFRQLNTSINRSTSFKQPNLSTKKHRMEIVSSSFIEYFPEGDSADVQQSNVEPSSIEANEIASASSFKRLNDSKRGSASFKRVSLPTKKHTMKKAGSSSNEDSDGDSSADVQQSNAGQPDNCCVKPSLSLNPNSKSKRDSLSKNETGKIKALHEKSKDVSSSDESSDNIIEGDVNETRNRDATRKDNSSANQITEAIMNSDQKVRQSSENFNDSPDEADLEKTTINNASFTITNGDDEDSDGSGTDTEKRKKFVEVNSVIIEKSSIGSKKIDKRVSSSENVETAGSSEIAKVPSPKRVKSKKSQKKSKQKSATVKQKKTEIDDNNQWTDITSDPSWDALKFDREELAAKKDALNIALLAQKKILKRRMKKNEKKIKVKVATSKEDYEGMEQKKMKSTKIAEKVSGKKSSIESSDKVISAYEAYKQQNIQKKKKKLKRPVAEDDSSSRPSKKYKSDINIELKNTKDKMKITKSSTVDNWLDSSYPSTSKLSQKSTKSTDLKKTQKKKMKIMSEVPFGFREEPASPKVVNGFQVANNTPKSIGYKVRSILSAGQHNIPLEKIADRKKAKKPKSKTNQLDENFSPKHVWTSSGYFLVSDVDSVPEKKKEHRPETYGARTDFVVHNLNDDSGDINRKRKASHSSEYSSSISTTAMEFKRKAIFNDKVQRETSKELLQRKIKKRF